VCWPRPGQELTISYGDKGNEELLLLYGFALPANPHDTLMVPCPLPPPDQWKEDTPLRLQLLMVRGPCMHSWANIVHDFDANDVMTAEWSRVYCLRRLHQLVSAPAAGTAAAAICLLLPQPLCLRVALRHPSIPFIPHCFPFILHNHSPFISQLFPIHSPFIPRSFPNCFPTIPHSFPIHFPFVSHSFSIHSPIHSKSIIHSLPIHSPIHSSSIPYSYPNCFPIHSPFIPHSFHCVHPLQAQGLRPQLFLTRSHLNTLDAQQQKRTSTRRSPSPGSSSTCIPEQAQQVLSVFVLSARELQPRLQQLQREVHATGGVAVAPPSSPGGKQTTSSSSSSGSRRGDSSKLQQASALVEELGVHMAMITTFVRLLELQLLRLEGPEGTGPLEQDEQLLQQLLDQVASSSGGSTDTGKTGRTPTAAAAAGVGAQRAAGAASAAGDAWLRSCVAYRVGQKQLVRGYLRHATAELNDTMAALTAAVAEEEGLRERA
jgi:hypothetical protein